MDSLVFIFRIPIRLALRPECWPWGDTNSAVEGLKAILLKCEFDAKEQGYPAGKIQDARVAIVGLIDEKTNLAVSAQPDVLKKYDDWLTSTLGAEMLKHGFAGQRFFEKLDELIEPDTPLSDIDAKVLELYVMSLRLGFKGRHNQAADRVTLRDLLDNALVKLGQTQESDETHALIADISSAARVGKTRKQLLWYSVAIASLLLLVSYSLTSTYLSGVRQDVHAVAVEPLR